MTTDDIKRVVEKFITYLQLPESPYTLTESDSSDEVEMQIAKGEELLAAVSITNGSVSILYNGDYDDNKFFKHDFQSPIYLLYIISVVYYSTVCKEISISFDDLMTIVIGEEITNWKDLTVNLAKAVMLNAEADMDDVLLENKKLSYDDYNGKIEYGSLEFQIEPYSYTQLIEAIFLIVEYVATIKETQDSLFTDEAKDNLIEEEQESEEDVGMGGGSFSPPPMDDFGGDDIIGDGDFGDEGAPEPVTPEDALDSPVDMDFSMPDGMDQEGMDSLIEPPDEG